ncbi:PREDICTED: neuronal pentraxin-2-like [Branchiostoma belcheri]|uniref:Neuronal pentraxin-2-like n=1 Tax=Branchiostoma belcheri TaxID=7741 RepID=A0A6P4XM55_BRABE|nr:PREDICTED: neuronal pentraxin-2-like [Branchiostoma belcheri]
MDSGIYTIYLRQAGGKSNYNARIPVFCRVEDGRAWTVIQRRQGGSVNFYNRIWEDYSRGFGNLWREVWLGNDKIHLLTNQGDSQKIIFPGPRGIVDYARMETILSEDLTSFTLCVHMRSNMDSSNDINLVSYAVPEHDNELLLNVEGGFLLFLQSEIHMADPPVWDGEWHTICTTWSNSDGAWQLYADGVLTASGSGFRMGGRVRTGGTWILGQDQDVVGGEFEAHQSFIGELSGVNLWDRVLSPAETGVDCSYHGNVIDWDTTNITVFGQASRAEYQCGK